MIQDLILDKKYKDVGVKLSGGADSAIVYYAVCDYYKNTNTNVYALTMGTLLKPWYPVGSAKLIKIVGKLTGVYPVEHYIHHQPDHTAISGGEAYAEGIMDMDELAVKRFELDAIYSGLTVNPPVDEMQRFFKDNHLRFGLNLNELMGHIDGRDASRDTTLEPTFFTKRYGLQRVDRIRPFINKNKQAVHAAYQAHDMMEQLYPYTYSCETVPEDYSTMDFVHCGHCFFCLERYWGFGRIV
jgi:hypothetical protein